MKIDIVATEGSPMGITEQSIYGIDGRRGVGGAELGILTLCRLLRFDGHDVTFYNDPHVVGGSEFKHGFIRDFRPHDERDILICFRSPNEDIVRHAKGKKIWYSNDQMTTGDYARFAQLVDKVVCISKHHKEYFQMAYSIYGAEVVDIPIRTWEYHDAPKKPNSCIYTSVPDRGLIYLAPIWKHIVEVVPDATLTITGDWSLWNNLDYSHEVAKYRTAFAGIKGVNYISATSRQRLIEIQSEAEYHLYPHVSEFPELFCISLAESQVAGVIPITSRIGAIEETNRFGYKINGHPQNHQFKLEFINKVVELMQSKEREDIRPRALEEFSNDKVLKSWYRIFEL